MVPESESVVAALGMDTAALGTDMAVAAETDSGTAAAGTGIAVAVVE